ncbi:MAG: hypothetical protein ACYTDU_18585, partial [Planctomycetota bacterium]
TCASGLLEPALATASSGGRREAMRTLGLALLSCLPLRAGDRSPLQEAVELFGSPDAGKRAPGSQLAERELR